MRLDFHGVFFFPRSVTLRNHHHDNLSLFAILLRKTPRIGVFKADVFLPVKLHARVFDGLGTIFFLGGGWGNGVGGKKTRKLENHMIN